VALVVDQEDRTAVDDGGHRRIEQIDGEWDEALQARTTRQPHQHAGLPRTRRTEDANDAREAKGSFEQLRQPRFDPMRLVDCSRRTPCFKSVRAAGTAVVDERVFAGRRMAIESDRAEALSGVRHGRTTGGPIALMIPNKDWDNWQKTMHVEAVQPPEATGSDRPVVTRPRPGHADLAGVVKYGHDDIRNVLERASARETAARVAIGALSRQLLAAVGAEIVSHVFSIGAIALPDPLAVTFEEARAIPADSPLHCVDVGLEKEMIAQIDRAREAG